MSAIVLDARYDMQEDVFYKVFNYLRPTMYKGFRRQMIPIEKNKDFVFFNGSLATKLEENT